MKKLRKILLLVLVAALLSVSVLAATGVVDAKLTYRDIKITLDGETVEPKDANGKSPEPFIMNDSTYLPVRALAEALGCTVLWDDAANTVRIYKDTVPADTAIRSVKALGFVDVDGPKVKAIAVEYACDLSGVKVDKDTFAIELNDTSVAVNAKSRNFGGGEIGDAKSLGILETFSAPSIIVAADTDFDYEYKVAYAGTSNEAAGSTVAEKLCANLPEGSNVVVMRGPLGGVSFDQRVAGVTAKLEEKGIRDNTLIVYTSDNGFSCGQHGVWGKGNATFPLNLFDTAVKVPCIFNFPGVIRAGVKTDVLLSAYDFMPTLLDLLGYENPEAAELPGRSFKNLLLSDASEEYHEAITVFDEYGPNRMIRTKEWKYIHRYPYGPHELYDLVHDEREQFNLLEENRCFFYGPKFIEAKAAEMKAMLDDWFARYVNPEIDGAREPVCGRGQLCRLGKESNGQVTFSPVSQREYSR